MPDCPGCGREISAEDAFCRHCGLKQGGASDPRESFMREMAARFERRLKDEAGDTDAAFNLALTHFHAGHYAEAIPLLRQVLQAMPEFADARGKLAVSLWQTGECAEGLAEMQQAVAQAPGEQGLRKLLAQMTDCLMESSQEP